MDRQGARDLPGLTNARLALEVAPALLGVGYILGQRYASITMAGGFVASLALAPLITSFLTPAGGAAPALDAVNKGYVRYILAEADRL